jgi:hypothetical protein
VIDRELTCRLTITRCRSASALVGLNFACLSTEAPICRSFTRGRYVGVVVYDFGYAEAVVRSSFLLLLAAPSLDMSIAASRPEKYECATMCCQA